MVRDFYKTRRIVSIDNDNLEPFFGNVQGHWWLSTTKNEHPAHKGWN